MRHGASRPPPVSPLSGGASEATIPNTPPSVPQLSHAEPSTPPANARSSRRAARSKRRHDTRTLSASRTADLTRVIAVSLWPSSVAPTDAQTSSAISAATFFEMRCSRMPSSTGSRSAAVSTLFPVAVCRNEPILPKPQPSFPGSSAAAASSPPSPSSPSSPSPSSSSSHTSLSASSHAAPSPSLGRYVSRIFRAARARERAIGRASERASERTSERANERTCERATGDGRRSTSASATRRFDEPFGAGGADGMEHSGRFLIRRPSPHATPPRSTVRRRHRAQRGDPAPLAERGSGAFLRTPHGASALSLPLLRPSSSPARPSSSARRFSARPPLRQRRRGQTKPRRSARPRPPPRPRRR